jgi:SprT-like family
MEVQLHQTREAWLHYVAQRMAPMFEQLGASLPAQLRIAIGFTSSGRRSRNIGECWDNQCSADRHFEIFIRPDLSESQEPMPMQVAAVLGHELVHAAVGVAAHHGQEFRRVARGIGLVGQMAATTAGPEFEQALRPILAAAGPLPHGSLRLAAGASSHSSRRKKPYSRQIKCACSNCGYTVYTSRKWLDAAGAPLCPQHGPMTVEKMLSTTL